MGFWDNVAKQYSHPRGLWGEFLGNFFARKNQLIYDWVLQLLDIQEDDNILEIGYGTGNAIKKAAKMAPKGTIIGADISEIMYNRAVSLNQREIESGKVVLMHGKIDVFNNNDIIINKAFAIHVLYFWKEPLVVLKQIRQMMKGCGKVVLFVDEKEDLISLKFPRSKIFNLYNNEEIEKLLVSAGFNNIIKESRRVSRFETGVCFLAECQ